MKFTDKVLLGCRHVLLTGEASVCSGLTHGPSVRVHRIAFRLRLAGQSSVGSIDWRNSVLSLTVNFEKVVLEQSD